MTETRPREQQERSAFLVEGELYEAAPWWVRRAPAALRDVHERESYRWWVLVTVLSGMFATGLTITVLTTAVPVIREDFGASLATLSWVVGAPFLFRSIFVPVFGKTGDRMGRRRTWLLGFAVSATASLLCGFAPNVGLLIFFRAVSAIASAAVIPSALALIAVEFDPEERVKALGWWSATIAVAPLIGVIVGGFIVEAFGWRWIFFGQFPFSVVALGLGMIVLHESKGDTEEQFDILGSVLSVVGLGALLLVVNRGIAGDWGWTSFPLVTTGLIAITALVAFVRVELRSSAPVLPVNYFRRRRFAAAVSANFCANFAYMGGFFITSVMLHDTQLFGYRTDQVALAISPRAASLGIMGPIGGYMAARYGGRRMATIGMVLIVASMVALAAVTDGSPYIYVLPGLVLSGFGLGLVAPPAAATVTNEADPNDLSAASGALNLGASIGSAMGIATMSAVLSTFAVTAEHPGSGAFSGAFMFGAGLSAVGLFAALQLGRDTGGATARR
jgi:EmrB/QacA subfamily drug resistance transporter